MKTENLILTPKRKAKEELFEKYGGLLDTVCGEGVDKENNKYFFQREAARCVFDYMTQYQNLEDLVREHTRRGGDYDTYYKQELGNKYLREFADKKKKIATIDLPTGSGKSFVMFAVAIILYNEIKEIKRIQVIVPSKTISRQLREKFEDLISKIERMQGIKLPSLTSLYEDMLASDMLAIDNIHRFYETQNAQRVKEDSFGGGKGSDTLILNDEAHHIYNAKDSIVANGKRNNLRNWLKFLLATKYNFKYIVNFTATPFEEQKRYLHNVIYRYSLNEAIDDRVVKEVRYLTRGDANLEEIDIETQQLQLADQQLNEIRKTFKKRGVKIKPFGVIVCDSINKASAVTKSMQKLLGQNDKVIAYTSKAEHLKNEQLFKTVDRDDNPIEWVVSVSMLTEGWDAKNVFVLVPHQERAFGSKLLISQMVGRGLRRIEKLDDDLNEVLILNHRAWGDTKIEMLINEVVDVSPLLAFGTTKEYHFKVNQLRKEYKSFELQLSERVNRVNFDEIVKKARQHFKPQQDISVDLPTDVVGKSSEAKTLTAKYSSDATDLDRDQIISWYRDTILPMVNIQDKYGGKKEVLIEYILGHDIVGQSAVRDKLSRYNFEVLVEELGNAFNGREELKTPPNANAKETPKEAFKYRLQRKNTETMPMDHIGADIFLGNYSSKKTVWYSPDTFVLEESRAYAKLVDQKTLKLPEELQDLDNSRDIVEKLVQNLFSKKKADEYKTPLEVVRWDSTPEYQFIKQLFGHTNNMRTWVKSRAQGFYAIEYSVENRNRHFNPDFIIRLKGSNTLIVEIKSAQDASKENAYKLRGLREYVNILNQKEKSKGTKYFGYLLRPKDYPEFFAEVIRNRNYEHIPEFHRELNRVL